MRWIRVKIHDMTKLVIPGCCPNCLSSSMLRPVSIVRTVGVPFGGFISHRSQWPFCHRCAAWVTRHTRWKTRYVTARAGLLALGTVIIALGTNDRGIHPSAWWLLLAAIVVAVVGTFIANLIQRFAKTPSDCLSNFPTVAPLRGGAAFLSGRIFGEFYFRHPIYVERLFQLNTPDNVSVDPLDFSSSMSKYLQKHPPEKNSDTEMVS